MTSLDTAIEAVRRVMMGLPEKAPVYAMSDDCPVDDLMHALTTMQLVEREHILATETRRAAALQNLADIDRDLL